MDEILDLDQIQEIIDKLTHSDTMSNFSFLKILFK